MSTVQLLNQVIEQANSLPVNEQLRLIEHLIHNMQQSRPKQHNQKWRDIRGMAQYPLMGEDAQAWVSKNRNDDNGSRQSQWSANQ